MRRLHDEVTIQIRIKSDDLDGHSLSELAQLLIATLEVWLVVLQVFADVLSSLSKGWGRLKRLWPPQATVANLCLAKAVFYQG